jgi:Protein of unknown function (DUF2878)
MRRNLALAVFFSLVATLCDRTWVDAGTSWYPKAPVTAVQAWWVPLLFAVAGLLAVHCAGFVTRRFIKSDPPARDWMAGFAVSASLFVAAWLACGLWDETRARRLTAILFVVWWIWFVVQRLRSDERIAVIVLTVGLAVFGTLFDVVLVKLGLFRYQRPVLLGVPLWLPALWSYGAFVSRDVARAWFGGR